MNDHEKAALWKAFTVSSFPPVAGISRQSSFPVSLIALLFVLDMFYNKAFQKASLFGAAFP
ncbi:hypothetical protein NKH33_30870 [Mesorhizobium sp. M1182]|uniref:hypothetical protein n=1 Tax=Mesorhizobium sp. M1182 TaxID=2957067 RepID=UPI003334FBDB